MSLKRILLAGLMLLVVLVGIIMVRALTLPSLQVSATPVQDKIFDEETLARQLSGAIAIRTISFRDPARFDRAAFAELHAYLARTYPAFHAATRRQALAGGMTLLYSWPGSDPKLKPAMLLAHTDVVPVEPGSEGRWTHPPFSGKVASGFVWGRGALDIKGSLVAMLAAADQLARSGHRPRRTLYFALGHDEEVNGSGNRAVVELLKKQKVSLEFLLDEGLPIADGMVPGLDKPAALIGVGEKGYLTLKLSARAPAGHSSRPPPQTAVGILAAAIARLEANQMPARLSLPSRQMFEHLAPEMAFGSRLALANLWLFKPVVLRQMAGGAETNAATRTTTAPTMIQGSPQENVLPSQAIARVNFRILPGETMAEVKDHVQRTMADPRVKVAAEERAMNSDPPPTSPLDAPGYRLVARAVREVFPEVHVAPGLMIGTSDSRWYAAGGLTRNIYRFNPVIMNRDLVASIHGTNERIAARSLRRMARFYERLLRHCDAP